MASLMGLTPRLPWAMKAASPIWDWRVVPAALGLTTCPWRRERQRPSPRLYRFWVRHCWDLAGFGLFVDDAVRKIEEWSSGRVLRSAYGNRAQPGRTDPGDGPTLPLRRRCRVGGGPGHCGAGLTS